MARFVDLLVRITFIDANILNDIADGQNEAVNQIVQLNENCELSIVLPHSVGAEVQDSKTPEYVKRAADRFFFSVEVTLTQPEWQRYYSLLEKVLGNAEAKNIAADLFHVCEAAKYGGYFITRDKRLLIRAQKILQVVSVEVVSPNEFLTQVEKAKRRTEELKKRDAV